MLLLFTTIFRCSYDIPLLILFLTDSLKSAALAGPDRFASPRAEIAGLHGSGISGLHGRGHGRSGTSDLPGLQKIGRIACGLADCNIAMDLDVFFVQACTGIATARILETIFETRVALSLMSFSRFVTSLSRGIPSKVWFSQRWDSLSPNSPKALTSSSPGHIARLLIA